MTERAADERATQRPAFLGTLTAIWVVGLLALVWRLVNLAFASWADQFSGRTKSFESEASTALLLLAVVAVSGPLVIAVVARIAGRHRAARVYAVVAVVLAVPAAPVLLGALQEWSIQRAPTVPDHVVCQESSGGDTRCPGG